MTEDDIDDGRLMAVVGVARVKPAQFVTFRVGQFTPGSSRRVRQGSAPAPNAPEHTQT